MAYSRLYWLCLIPVLLITVIPSSLQYGVGTDYFSYILIFEKGTNLDSYTNRGEFIFPLLVSIIKNFNLNAQFLFFTVSLLNGIMFLILLNNLKRLNYSVWLFVLVFFCCTGVYHNQLNGLRQYMAVYALPLIIIYLSGFRFTKLSMASIYSTASHVSSLMVFPLIFGSKLFVRYRISYFVVFVSTMLIYGLLLPKFLLIIIETLFPIYKYYLLEDRIESFSIISALTKLYYLPLFFIFYFLYYRKRIIIECSASKMFLMVFSSTYWLFLAAQDISIIGRVSQYFSIFYSFPIYFLLKYFFERKLHLKFLIVLVYIVAPYLAKITFLAKNEYLYRWIL